MIWLVCKYKDTGEMFITTRNARECMLSVIIDLGHQPDSIVLKEAESYETANKYKNDILNSDDQINKTLTPKD